MIFSLRKIHTIITAIAVICILAAILFFFFSEVDRAFGWDVFSGWVETMLKSIAWITAVMALGTGAVSVVLSQYRQAEHRDA